MLRRGALAFSAFGSLLAVALAACSASNAGPADSPDASAAGDADVDAAKLPARDAGALPEAAAPVTGPEKLSATGLYTDIASKTLSAGLIPIAPRYSFWADGAEKARWLSLPPGTVIDTSNMDGWVFPIGTKVWKEFRVAGKRVETRLLMKVRDDAPDGWWMAAYVWNADESEATLATSGVMNPLGVTHVVPSQTDCKNCHQGVRDVLIGVSAIQLSHTGEGYFTPPPSSDAGADVDAANPADASLSGDASTSGDAGDGGVGESILQSLAARGLLSNPPAADFDVPGDGVVKDALGYLHANCGSCHNAESPALAKQTNLRLRLSVAQTTPQSTGAYTTTFGTLMKHSVDGVTAIVTPGQPDASGLYVRMGHRDAFAMPPVGSLLVDPQGRDIVRRWIAGL